MNMDIQISIVCSITKDKWKNGYLWQLSVSCTLLFSPFHGDREKRDVWISVRKGPCALSIFVQGCRRMNLCSLPSWVLQAPRLRMSGHKWKSLIILTRPSTHSTCVQNCSIAVKNKWTWMSGRIKTKSQLLCSQTVWTDGQAIKLSASKCSRNVS